jgi:tRNA 2-thiouridine synthesizing protein C
MAKSILIFVRGPPYGAADSYAGLRLGLSTAVHEVDTKIILFGEGVYNALKGQNSKKIGAPSNAGIIEDVIAMGGTVYCLKEDLGECGVSTDELVEDIEIIPRKELSNIVDQCDLVATF